MTNIENVYFNNRDDAQCLLDTIIYNGQITIFDYEVFVDVFGNIPQKWNKKVKYIRFTEKVLEERYKKQRESRKKVAYYDKDVNNAKIIKIKDSIGLTFYKIKL